MVYLIDASVYVFRAYYSLPPDMRDGDGNPVHALYGFARFLGDLLERARPEYVAVAFDASLATSFRNRIYPAYKANREPAPAGPRLQFERCRELCEHLGIAWFVSPEYEADDIIGTLATRCAPRVCAARVVTRDKDMAQLIREGDVYWDYGGNARYHYRDIADRFGVAPERYADYLALTGDARRQHPGRAGRRPEDRGRADARFRIARRAVCGSRWRRRRCRSAARQLAARPGRIARPPISRASSPASTARCRCPSGARICAGGAGSRRAAAGSATRRGSACCCAVRPNALRPRSGVGRRR